MRALIFASDGMGMTRVATWQNDITDFDRSRACIGCTTDSFECRGSGLYDGAMADVVSIKVDLRIPAVRTDVTRADGTRTVTVAKDELTWDESTLGVWAAASDAPAAERMLPVYLLPPSAVVLAESAVFDISVEDAGDGTRVLPIPVPRLSTDLKATIDVNDFVTNTEIAYGGKVYSGEYSEFTNDHIDYHVMGPQRVVQKVDVVVVTDLVLEYHWANPYLVFPTPQELAAAQ